MENDLKIIEQWDNAMKGQDYKSFYNLLSQTNVPSPIIHTGKHKVKKSRWKLINFWRKLTKTEVMEEIILYSWTIPKINDKDL